MGRSRAAPLSGSYQGRAGLRRGSNYSTTKQIYFRIKNWSPFRRPLLKIIIIMIIFINTQIFYFLQLHSELFSNICSSLEWKDSEDREITSPDWCIMAGKVTKCSSSAVKAWSKNWRGSPELMLILCISFFLFLTWKVSLKYIYIIIHTILEILANPKINFAFLFFKLRLSSIFEKVDFVFHFWKKLRLSSIFEKIEVVFHFWKNWHCLPSCEA